MAGCGQVFLLSNQIVGLFDPQYIWKESIINGREHLRLPVLVGHLFILSKQIAVFPNKQYLWKELIDILDDFHGDIRQGKLACENRFYGCVMPGVPLVQSGCRII